MFVPSRVQALMPPEHSPLMTCLGCLLPGARAAARQLLGAFRQLPSSCLLPMFGEALAVQGARSHAVSGFSGSRVQRGDQAPAKVARRAGVGGAWSVCVGQRWWG